MSDTRRNRYVRKDWQDKIASYINNKDKSPVIVSSYLDNNMINEGEKWYLLGRNLEDAPEKLQKNRSFVVGYKKAITKKIVNTKFYEEGIKFGEKGIELCDIPEDYTSNPYFIKGYNETVNLKKKSSR